jgi:hypothetical protein
MSFPQPTQYRPRCSTALQWAQDDDIVPPRLVPSLDHRRSGRRNWTFPDMWDEP